MKGTAVRQIQEALAALYFYPDKGAKNNGIDGYYGPKRKAKLEAILK
ncbi:N-acetylmuramoyl-L-alanine amidase cwlL precursor (Cell wall hydrolase) (Autolysin) [Bacillus licheniformis]|nr:N-acetylmuramoyl-L-alanine amidase cwlL precursor (Cell wall hydrolase) (Autolysin) [Bacillus licheniformis]